jgi:hypothetical protein
VLGVYECGEGGFGGVVPLTRGGFSAGVLGGGDDFEVIRVKLGVEFLPAWQI